MNNDHQQLPIAQLGYPLQFADTHPLDRSLLTLRVLTADRNISPAVKEVAEAASTLAAYFDVVLQGIDEPSREAVPRIGDADWDELFLPKDRRLIASAVRSLKNMASGRHAARDVDTVERILNELQRRRRACDTYEEITSYDRTLDLL
jgi:hypothetical protein